MNEPLFAATAPTWPGVAPAFGWMQPGIGGRPFGIGTSPFGTLQAVQQAPAAQMAPGQTPAYKPAWDAQAPVYGPLPQPYGLASGLTMLAQPGPVFGPGSTAGPMFGATPGLFGMPGNFLQPVPVAQEVSMAMAAPAILAAVAMRRGQPMGPTNDHEVEEFVYDALELLPGTSEVDVRCDNGRATLTGTVQHKRLKRDIGEIAWAIPQITDVQNNVTIATRRRPRTAPREAEAAAGSGGRKQG